MRKRSGPLMGVWLACCFAAAAAFWWAFLVLPLLLSVAGALMVLVAWLAGIRIPRNTLLLLAVDAALGVWIIQRAMYFQWPAGLATPRGLLWLLATLFPAAVVTMHLHHAARK